MRKVYLDNLFGSMESRSGSGSSLESTIVTRTLLRDIINGYGITTILDAPCGDMNWISSVIPKNISYIGIDVVPELILSLRENNNKSNREFILIDLTVDRQSLPNSDLILCRDLLPHLSFREIKTVLRNFRNSGSKYLLTTTFSNIDGRKLVNKRLRMNYGTYGWRPIDLSRRPWKLKPIAEFSENSEEALLLGLDKKLALYELKSI